MAASVLIGIFTHILWDDFTHESGLFVTMVPELKLYFGLDMPLYSFLQLASSVVGATLLAWAYWRWVRRVKPRTEPLVPQLSFSVRISILAICVVAMLAFALPYGARVASEYPPELRSSAFIAKSIIGAITAGFMEMVVYSLAWRLRKEKAPEISLEG